MVADATVQMFSIGALIALGVVAIGGYLLYSYYCTKWLQQRPREDDD